MFSKIWSRRLFFSRKRRSLFFPRKLASPFRFIRIFKYSILATFIPLVFYLTVRSGILTVKEVSVYFEGWDFNSEIIKGSIQEKSLGKNVLFLRGEVLANEIKREFLSVVEVKITKKIKRISVLVKQREPVAAVIFLDEQTQATSSSQLLSILRESSPSAEIDLVDKNGLLFFRDRQTALPLLALFGEKPLNLGDSLTLPLGKFMVEIASIAREKGIQVSSISSFRSDVLLNLVDPTVVFLTPSKDPSLQLEIMRTILEKYRIEAKKVGKIDLRFRNPVVEFR